MVTRSTLFGILLSSLALFLCACGGGGGGGGGGSATIVGRVLQVETGGPPNPQASVQAGSNSTLTSPADGSFQLGASNGTSQISVDSMTQTSGVWNFTIPPASGVTDVGDLWIGPERVHLKGTVRDTTNNGVIANALVTFGGASGLTNALGEFDLFPVAYSSATQVAFWGIVGTVRHSLYFRTDFSAQPNIAIGDVVNVGDVFLTPLSDPTPPGPPYNIWGMVTATGGPSGAVVKLIQGGVDVRVFNVGADGRYLFFVVPGTYTIRASKGATTLPDVIVTLTQPNEVIRSDFAFP